MAFLGCTRGASASSSTSGSSQLAEDKPTKKTTCKCNHIAAILFAAAILATAMAVVGFAVASFPTGVAIVASASALALTIGGVWALFRAHDQS